MRSTSLAHLAVLIVCTSCTARTDDAGNRASSVAAPAGGTHAVMLGTGTPNADPERSGPSVAVVVDGHAYLVDAGPGIVRRAAAAAIAGDSALQASRLDIVFLSHLHSDHTVGLPDLMFTTWVLGRVRPLRVYGPPGTRAMVEHLHAAWQADIDVRVDGLEPANVTGHQVEVHEIQPGLAFEDENVRVVAYALPHGSWDFAYGYRFEAADRTVFVSGDTGPAEAVVEACDGCDLMIHEVYSTAGFATRTPDWKRYHSTFHTSTAELAALAGRARPGLLVLYHQLYWGTTDEDLVREMRAAGYTGEIIAGRDLAVY